MHLEEVTSNLRGMKEQKVVGPFVGIMLVPIWNEISIQITYMYIRKLVCLFAIFGSKRWPHPFIPIKPSCL